jgi:N-succinyldiaminopimelate aminotransferase
VLPVNGTREALFAFAQAVVERRGDPLVVLPNPFYQIYEGAALLAGAEPHFLNCDPVTGVPDFDAVPAAVWRRCQLLFLCSPHNPTGGVLDLATLQRLIGLAEAHDFILAADECYSEIYFDEANPPPGLLQAAAALGETAYRRCLVFHSLSKRSNVPWAALRLRRRDAALVERFFSTAPITAASCPCSTRRPAGWPGRTRGMCTPTGRATGGSSTPCWRSCNPVLEVQRPAAGFYLWPRTPIEDDRLCPGAVSNGRTSPCCPAATCPVPPRTG